mmetsp:Transcript_1129/g.3732  ORF Transcript_1129/g.3732 Transcript_1129/m.3732 type:complete len:316 (+) Transcript_1129:329-1276(+)
MLPSYPPDASSVSCCGCHATDVTSRVCPLKHSISRIVRTSCTFNVWSLHPVTNQFPLTFHRRHVTWFLWSCSVPTHFPPFASHSFTSESLPPDASNAFDGCQSTHLTSPPCPESACTAAARAKSHTFTVVSSEHEQNLRSVGANASARTGSSCALICFMLFKLVCQYFTTPASSPERNQFSLCEKTHARIAQLCACKIVSKLKLMPFHSVNSPFCEHVSSLRPSGVNVATFTGVRILFVETCTNFVANDVAGRCAYATGGRKSSIAPDVGCSISLSHRFFWYTRDSTCRTAVAEWSIVRLCTGFRAPCSRSPVKR